MRHPASKPVSSVNLDAMSHPLYAAVIAKGSKLIAPVNCRGAEIAHLDLGHAVCNQASTSMSSGLLVFPSALLRLVPVTLPCLALSQSKDFCSISTLYIRRSYLVFHGVFMLSQTSL